MSAVTSSETSRLELFLGKGGVGKTTIAAAAALGALADGGRILLVSVDQSHSLADVFHDEADPDSVGRGVAPHIEPLAVVAGLDVLELNSLEVLEADYRSFTPLMRLASGGHEHGDSFGILEPEELVGFPGAQELLMLHRLVELVERGTWDDVLVDFPATADSLRILSLPGLFCDYLERTWPQHDRVIAGTGKDARATIVVALVERIAARVAVIRDVLFDPHRTSATVVTTTDRLSRDETVRTLSATALMGVPVTRIVVNKVLPELESVPIPMVGIHPAVFWFEKWRAEQQSALDELRVFAAPVPVTVVPQTVDEPIGLKFLHVLSEHLSPAARPVAAGAAPGAPIVSWESGTGLDSIYTMRLRLPVVDTSSIGLGRVHNDLIVGVDGVRTRVPLASVLRRCVVSSAEFTSGDLVVRFEPDPEVWPT